MSVIVKGPYNGNVAGLREGEDETGSCSQPPNNKRRVESMENISSSVLLNNNNNNIILPQPSKPLVTVEKSPVENDLVRFCFIFHIM